MTKKHAPKLVKHPEPADSVDSFTESVEKAEDALDEVTPTQQPPQPPMGIPWEPIIVVALALMLGFVCFVLARR